jgi:hypothetical protein
MGTLVREATPSDFLDVGSLPQLAKIENKLAHPRTHYSSSMNSLVTIYGDDAICGKTTRHDVENV